LLFASLFAKVFRVTRIFRPRNKKSFRVLAIQDSALLLGVLAMWLIEMIYTIAWHTNSPLVPVHNSNPHEQYWVCEAEEPLWGIIDVLANALFLLYGVLLSVQSRHIPTLFNEARYVAATMYNTLIVGGIAFAMGFGVANNNDELYIYKSLGAFLVFSTDIGLLIASKFPSLHAELVHGIIPQFKKDSSSDTSAKQTVEPKTKTSRESTSGRPSSAPTSKVELEVRSEAPSRADPPRPAPTGDEIRVE
jgi:hypothetical protein